MSFRVIIAGTRSFTDYALLERYCNTVLYNKQMTGEKIIILSGHCRGVDVLGERYANSKGYQVELYPAEWERYGKRAGIIRNEIMVQRAEALIAIWDGQSHGTQNIIKLAERYGLKIRIKMI